MVTASCSEPRLTWDKSVFVKFTLYFMTKNFEQSWIWSKIFKMIVFQKFSYLLYNKICLKSGTNLPENLYDRYPYFSVSNKFQSSVVVISSEKNSPYSFNFSKPQPCELFWNVTCTWTTALPYSQIQSRYLWNPDQLRDQFWRHNKDACEFKFVMRKHISSIFIAK